MKKIVFLLALLPMLLLTSCEEKNHNPMPGNWKLSVIFVNGMDMYNSPLIDMVGMQCIREATIVCNEDLSAKMSFCDEDIDLTYTFLDGICTLSAPHPDNANEVISFSGEVLDGTLMLNFPEQLLGDINAMMEQMGYSSIPSLTELKMKFVLQ